MNIGVTSQQLAGLGRDVMANAGAAWAAVLGMLWILAANPGQAEQLLNYVRQMHSGGPAALTALGGLLTLSATIWRLYKNSQNGIAKTAATELPAGTMIVTSKAIADATPDQKNIVSDTQHAVIPLKSA